jgi:hypothetical protein
MNYIRVEWHHDEKHYPVLLYSELDDERWEVRKVEVYRDGRVNYADRTSSTGVTGLGVEPMPSTEEIAADPQFVPSTIDSAEFEEQWRLAIHGSF